MRRPKRYARNAGPRVTTTPEVRQDVPGRGPKRADRMHGRAGREGGPEEPSIKSQYWVAVDNIAEEEGTARLGFDVPRDATLAQCIGYTQDYVVRLGQERPHYRYERYLTTLRKCMQELPFQWTMPTAMHLDLGAGPGLFTWVVWDYVRSETTEGRELSLDLFGHDYAPEMSRLARRLWDAFGLPATYGCFASEEEVYANVWPQGPPTNVLITLGHSLIQVHKGGDGGLAVFAELCEAVAGLDETARLVAVDAHGGDRPREFDSAWEEFVSLMPDSRVEVKHTAPSERVATVEVMSGPWRRR